MRCTDAAALERELPLGTSGFGEVFFKGGRRFETKNQQKKKALRELEGRRWNELIL